MEEIMKIKALQKAGLNNKCIKCYQAYL